MEGEPPPRDRLLLAAQKLFAIKGYRGTGVQEIVEAVGVTKPTLYYYFGSKAGLYRTLVEKAFDERFERIQKAAESAQGIQAKLVGIMESLLSYTRENTELMKIAYANIYAAPEEVPEEVRSLRKINGTFEYVHDLIRTAQKNGELESTYDSEELTIAIYGQFIIAGSTMTLTPHRWQATWGANMVKIFCEGAMRQRGDPKAS